MTAGEDDARRKAAMQQRTIDKTLREDVLARTRGVTELLKAAAPRIETARELPPDVLQAMHAARLFRLLLPRSVGSRAPTHRRLG
jgi:hypothetical protein